MVEAKVMQIRRQRRVKANSSTPESKVIAAVKEWAKDRDDVYLIRVVSAGENGVPDIVLSIKGIFVGVECKAGNNKPRALQLLHGSRITNTGGIFLWGNTERVIPELDALYAMLG